MERQQGYLLDPHQLCVVEDEDDAKDDQPGNEVEDEADEGNPSGPGLSASSPEHGAILYWLPVSHQQLHEKGKNALAADFCTHA